MKRSILTGILALVAGTAALMGQAAQPKGPAPKSKAELDALQALFQQANNPDQVATLADDFIKKFPDTDFKENILNMEAEAWHQKKDDTKAQIYAEQALQANPKSYQADILLAEVIAKTTRETDLDREEKLGKAEKYAKDAIDVVKDAPKPNPQVPDAQWEDFKKGVQARAHGAIGIANLTRKKYDVAAGEFKSAFDADPQPAYQVQQASALQSGGKNDEAIALCDKLLADPQLHPAIKNVATQVRAQAVKAGGKAPGGNE
jgi:tetratricopeptide (TPR) repeat protein